MTFVLLLTFLVGGGVRHETLRCPDWECVQEVRDALPMSERVVRLRVFRGEPSRLPAGGTVFPPLINEWRS